MNSGERGKPHAVQANVTPLRFLPWHSPGCPVRRMYTQGAFPSKQIMEEQGDLVDNESEEGTLDLQSNHLFKKLLPDRSKAARNLANEKLVQFIVEKRAVEKHLQVGQMVQNREWVLWEEMHLLMVHMIPLRPSSVVRQHRSG